MILIIKDKDGVIEKAVQLGPRDVVEFENNIHGGVKAKVNKTSWDVYGSVTLLSDTGQQIGYQSYKDLVSRTAVRLKSQICLKAYDQPVKAPNGMQFFMWSKDPLFEPSVAAARALTYDQLLWEGTPVIVVPVANGFTIASTAERYNNKSPIDLATGLLQTVSFWTLPEWQVSNDQNITDWASVNLITSESIRAMLGPPVPNFHGAIAMLREDILKNTCEHIEEVCQEALNAL